MCSEGLQFTYRTVPLAPYSAGIWSEMLVRTNVSRMMGRGLTVGGFEGPLLLTCLCTLQRTMFVDWQSRLAGRNRGTYIETPCSTASEGLRGLHAQLAILRAAFHGKSTE